MSSTYGESLNLSIFGQSHGTAIGMTLCNFPAGLPVDTEKLSAFLARRAPGNADYATPRKEADQPEFLSGIVDGYTCGAPITAIIRNTNTRSNDYKDLKDTPRPGHADYTAGIKYNGYQDVAGGGHFSGRLTAPLCIAGGLCKQWLSRSGIEIGAYICSIGNVVDPATPNMTNPDLSFTGNNFPVFSPDMAQQMQLAISDAKEAGDSVGGVIGCIIKGVPAGIGGPIFEGLESKIASIIYGVPAVKGLEFGSGFSGAGSKGSQNNDAFCIKDNKVTTVTNHAGGILGGISNGMPITFRVAFKPTPSIALPQQTVSLSKMEQTILTVKGRHDPCIVPRAVPVVEAAAAIAIMDAIL